MGNWQVRPWPGGSWEGWPQGLGLSLTTAFPGQDFGHARPACVRVVETSEDWSAP